MIGARSHFVLVLHTQIRDSNVSALVPCHRGGLLREPRLCQDTLWQRGSQGSSSFRDKRLKTRRRSLDLKSVLPFRTSWRADSFPEWHLRNLFPEPERILNSLATQLFHLTALSTIAPTHPQTHCYSRVLP